MPHSTLTLVLAAVSSVANASAYPRLMTLPALPAPVARCAVAAVKPTHKGGDVLAIPVRAQRAAGLVGETVQAAQLGAALLIGRNVPTGQPITAFAQGGAGRLAVSRVPEALRTGCIAILGAGYVLLVPEEEAARLWMLPSLERYEGELVEDRVRVSDTELPPMRALAFRDLRTVSLDNGRRALEVRGNVWELAGIGLNSPLQVTRFRDGVLVRQVPQALANSALCARKKKNGIVYGAKRFGNAVLETLEGDEVRVLVSRGALALVDRRYDLTRAGLSNRHRYHTNTPRRGVGFDFAQADPAAALRALGNAAAAIRSGDMLPAFARLDQIVVSRSLRDNEFMVMAPWLAAHGCRPGHAFDLLPHPLFTGRLLVRIHAAGRQRVEQGPLGMPILRLAASDLTGLLGEPPVESLLVYGSAAGVCLLRVGPGVRADFLGGQHGLEQEVV